MSKSSQPRVSFTLLLLVVGAGFSLVVLLDLGSRGMHRLPDGPDWEIRGADPARGRTAIEKYGCGSCHVIPGVRQADGRVGPQLNDFSSQIYIAGKLANIPENLVRWIQYPDEVDPGTAMPNLGVSEEEARDIAAFLYGLQ